MPAMFEFIELKNKLKSIDLAFILYPVTQNLPSKLVLEVKNKLPITVTFTDTATNQVEQVDFKQEIKEIKNILIVLVNLKGVMKKKEYLVSIFSLDELQIEQNGKLYWVKLEGAKVLYKNPTSGNDIENAEKFAAPVATMTNLVNGDSALSLSLMGGLLAADPTGTFFRFTKILQIVNKLYFININYGKRLEAFLAKSAESAIKKDNKNSII